MVIVLGSQVIYYEHYAGDEGAKPVILLHGNGENHHIFDKLSRTLGSDFDIYAPDTRGHGMSACPKELHYADMAEDLYHFIEELSIDHPIIVGFSDGAVTALLFAIDHSDMISSVISCGANTNPKAIVLKERSAIKKAYKKKISSKTSIDKDIDTLSSEIYAETGAYEKLMLEEPDISESDLSRITVPVTVIAGEHDLVKESDTRKIASAIPDSRLEILPGEDHGSYVIDSDRLASYIR